jgi:hypothetical protein
MRAGLASGKNKKDFLRFCLTGGKSSGLLTPVERRTPTKPTKTMKTIQDIKDLCASRNLNIDCILKYASTANQDQSFKGLGNDEKISMIYDIVEQWSRTPDHIWHLEDQYGITGWACSESHAIGKQLALSISSAPLFA